jgi:hypothetical protein
MEPAVDASKSRRLNDMDIHLIYTELTKLVPIIDKIRTAIPSSDKSSIETHFLHAGLSVVSGLRFSRFHLFTNTCLFSFLGCFASFP